MNTERPKIKVPFEPLDVVVDFISITLLILLIVFTFLEFNNLPETIATHFNAKGEADDYGTKNTIWLLPIIGIIMFGGLFVLNRFPHLHNYMVNITEDNALRNYRFSTRILRFVNFFMVVLFAYIQYVMIATAKGASISFGNWFLPVIIGLCIILPAFLIIYQYKMNKK